jgi:hypothetical protein
VKADLGLSHKQNVEPGWTLRREGAVEQKGIVAHGVAPEYGPGRKRHERMRCQSAVGEAKEFGRGNVRRVIMVLEWELGIEGFDTLP